MMAVIVVAAMVKEMHQWARGNQQERQCTVKVSRVFSHQEEQRDSSESREDDPTEARQSAVCVLCVR